MDFNLLKSSRWNRCKCSDCKRASLDGVRPDFSSLCLALWNKDSVYEWMAKALKSLELICPSLQPSLYLAVHSPAYHLISVSLPSCSSHGSITLTWSMLSFLYMYRPEDLNVYHPSLLPSSVLFTNKVREKICSMFPPLLNLPSGTAFQSERQQYLPLQSWFLLHLWK